MASPREKGAAAVEMAFMTVLLFILAAGIIDLGRGLFTYIGVQDAAQEGALYGSYDYDPSAIIDRVIDSTDYPDLSSTDATITTSCLSGPDPDQVEVTVDYELDLITPIVGQWFGGSLTLSRTFTGTVFLGCP